jgi:ribose transport system substrate-binding protein
MKRKGWLVVLLVSILVVPVFVQIGAISVAAQEKIVDPYTSLPMFDPNEYLRVLGEKYANVALSPAMLAEKINTPDTGKWKSSPPPWRFGYSDITVHNPWRMTVWNEAKYEAEKYPKLIKEMYQVEAGGDISKQIADIEDLIAKGVNALLISPGSPGALVPVIEKAYDKGIPVILLNGRINSEKFTSECEHDEFGMGWLFATWLGKQLNGKGSIIGIKGLAGYKDATDRWNGALAGIAQYPGIKLLGSEFGQWSPVEGRRAATNLLAAYPHFDGILSIDPWGTAAILELMAAAGRPMVPTTGFEENSSFRAWKKYDVTGIGANEPTWLSAEAVKIAIKVLQGEPIYKRYVALVPIVDKAASEKLYRGDMPDSYYPGSHLPEEVLKKIFK